MTKPIHIVIARRQPTKQSGSKGMVGPHYSTDEILSLSFQIASSQSLLAMTPFLNSSPHFIISH